MNINSFFFKTVSVVLFSLFFSSCSNDNSTGHSSRFDEDSAKTLTINYLNAIKNNDCEFLYNNDWDVYYEKQYQSIGTPEFMLNEKHNEYKKQYMEMCKKSGPNKNIQKQIFEVMSVNKNDFGYRVYVYIDKNGKKRDVNESFSSTKDKYHDYRIYYCKEDGLYRINRQGYVEY